MLRAHTPTPIPIEELKRCLAVYQQALQQGVGVIAIQDTIPRLIRVIRTVIEAPDYDTQALQAQLSDDEYSTLRGSSQASSFIEREVLQLPSEIGTKDCKMIYGIWFPNKTDKQIDFTYQPPESRQRNAPSPLARALARALSHNTTMESFILNGDGFSIEDMTEIGKGIEKNKHLQSIMISSLMDIDDELTSILIKSISANKTIRSISFLNDSIGNKSAIALKNLLASVDTKNHVVKLGMSISKINLENLNIISEGLTTNTTLEIIDMRYVGDEEAQVISKSIINHPSLKKLCFPKLGVAQSIGPRGATSIAHALLERKSDLMPIAVEFYNQPIGDEGASSLCEPIVKNKISELYISDESISNNVKVRLFEAISTAKYFHNLSIEFYIKTPFDQETGESLNEALIKNKRIKKLYIAGFYTESSLSQIQRLLKEKNGLVDISFSMQNKIENGEEINFENYRKNNDYLSKLIIDSLRENFTITELKNYSVFDKNSTIESTLKRNRKISEANKRLTSIFSSGATSKTTILNINDDTLITRLKQEVTDVIKELQAIFKDDDANRIVRCPVYQACLQLLQLIEICTDTHIDIQSCIQRLSLLKDLGFEEISDVLCQNLISRLLTEILTAFNQQSEECHHIRLHILIIAHLLLDANQTEHNMFLIMQSLMRTPEEIQSGTFSNKTFSEYQSDVRFNKIVAQPINDICASLGIETPHIFRIHPTAAPTPDLPLLPAPAVH